MFFGDARANAYAVDAQTGQQIWTRKVDEHRRRRITGAPAVYDGRLYVPVQGLSEEGTGGTRRLPVLHVPRQRRGARREHRQVLWKTYTIDEPKPRGEEQRRACQMWGPAGGGIWSSPTVDAKRSVVYVATGNGYADPPQRLTDAVVALDLGTAAACTG